MMAKKKSRTAKPTKWYLAISQAELNEATEEAIVDAYDESEQHSGFISFIDDCLEFPFSGRALGMDIIVTGVYASEEDPFAIDFQVKLPDGTSHRLDVRFVEPNAPFPAGYQYLAAYMIWRSQLG